MDVICGWPPSFNSRQEARVVVTILSPEECADAYEKGFLMLKSLELSSWNKLRHIISDFQHSPTLGYEKVEGKPIEVWTGCEESYDFKPKDLYRIFS